MRARPAVNLSGTRERATARTPPPANSKPTSPHLGQDVVRDAGRQARDRRGRAGLQIWGDRFRAGEGLDGRGAGGSGVGVLKHRGRARQRSSKQRSAPPTSAAASALADAMMRATSTSAPGTRPTAESTAAIQAGRRGREGRRARRGIAASGGSCGFSKQGLAQTSALHIQPTAPAHRGRRAAAAARVPCADPLRAPGA